MLDQLITRLRADEMSLDQFATEVAANFAVQAYPEYPEYDVDYLGDDVVSNTELSIARADGTLTADELAAVNAKLGV